MAILELFEREQKLRTAKRRKVLFICLSVVLVLGAVIVVSYLIVRQPPKTNAPETPLVYDETVAEAADRISIETNALINDENTFNSLIAELNKLMERAANNQERAEIYRLQGKVYANANRHDQAAAAYEKGVELRVAEYNYMFYRSLFSEYEQLGNHAAQIKYLKLLLEEPYEGDVSSEVSRDYYVQKLNNLGQDHD
jgi:cytochrome c-type biogenesis protein CcmH/NrfG